MEKIRKINEEEYELASNNQVIGWYRSSNKEIQLFERDIGNQIAFQLYDPKSVCLIIEPKKYLDPNEIGFSLFRLEGDTDFDLETNHYQIPWGINPSRNAQDVIANFKQYIRNYFLDKPLVIEFGE